MTFMQMNKMVGIKQKLLLKRLQLNGYVTLEDIGLIFNIKNYERQTEKARELLLLGWIIKHNHKTGTYLMGKDFPYDKLENGIQ
jgi:hypothetical protein